MQNKTMTSMLALLLLLVHPTTAQNQENDKGYVYGRIFSEFNTTLEGPEDQTAFEVKRAYFGYFRELQDGFSAEVTLDIGSPNDVSNYSLLRRFAYFRNAALYYTHNNLRLEFGLISTAQFKVAENFWSRRYIYKAFQDEYKFGPSADIGLKAVYTTGVFEFDAGIFNGEGYSSLQNDNTFKVAGGATAKPLEGLTLRLYGDFASKSIDQSTISFFAGQKMGPFALGAEYNYQFNRNFEEEHDRFGYSLVGGYTLTEKWNFFGRYDYLDSNIPEGENLPWALADDGSALIGGVEFKASKGIRFALNYQDWYPAAQNSANESSLHLNIEVRF